MTLSINFLAAQPATFGDNLIFMIEGFVIVMCGLILLALITWMNGLAFSRQVKPAVAKSAPAPVVDEGIDSETLAVIAAAAYSTFGRRVRMTRVKQVGTGGWGQAGRHDIQTSHNIRPGDKR